MEDVTLVGCFAYARRGFTDALKSLPENLIIAKTNAEKGIEFCNSLFKIERDLKKLSLSSEERYNERLKRRKLVLEDFLSWLKIKEKETLPKSGLGKAIKYCLHQWDKLEVVD